MVLDLFRLDGQVALVTGASRGIGAAVARALAACGADVVVAARDPERLEAFAGDLSASSGRRVVAHSADLGDLGSLPGLVEAAVSGMGRLDVLVNNVGGTMPRAFLDTSPGFLERAFHWNVSVAFQLTRLCVPHMLSGGGGSVVNVSSSMGHLWDRGYLAYGTAKAALDHLTRLASVDLAPRVRVNAVAPGSIDTDALAAVLDEDLRRTIESMTPLARLGTPDDVAAAVVYLASPAASYLTGKVVEVDGGIRVPNLPLGLPEVE